jgi:hypothetical protein
MEQEQNYVLLFATKNDGIKYCIAHVPITIHIVTIIFPP